MKPKEFKYEGRGGQAVREQSVGQQSVGQQSVAGQRLARRAALCALILELSGCYSYAYRGRGPGPDYQRVAIESSPHEEVRWSSWWGGHANEWSPMRCQTKDAEGHCTEQVPYCDYGLGQVEVSYTAASVLLTIVTLGIAVPMRVSAWCATDTGPHSGP